MTMKVGIRPDHACICITQYWTNVRGRKLNIFCIKLDKRNFKKPKNLKFVLLKIFKNLKPRFFRSHFPALITIIYLYSRLSVQELLHDLL